MTLARMSSPLKESGEEAASSFGSHPDNGGVNCPAAAEIPPLSVRSLFPLVSQLIDFSSPLTTPPLPSRPPSPKTTWPFRSVVLTPPTDGRGRRRSETSSSGAVFVSIQETIDQFFIRKNREGGGGQGGQQKREGKREGESLLRVSVISPAWSSAIWRELVILALVGHARSGST